MTAGEALAQMESFPYAGLDTILGGKRPLILAPHADDESLGCGGLIAECCRRGNQPVIAILTDGAASHPGSKQYPPFRLAKLREKEARSAVMKLGLNCHNVVFFGYPDAALPFGPEVVARIAELFRRRGCGIILAPWLHDPHCDHEATALIAQNAIPQSGCRLLFYPIWGRLLPPEQELASPCIHGWRLSISEHLAAKQQAIESHASQYSDLIADSVEGFRLPTELLDIFRRPYEVFIEAAEI